MTEKCHHRSDCRLCGSTRVTRVLELVPTPPANAFVAADKLAEAQQAFPLDLFFCEECAHLQMLDVVDPRLLFENYVYVSGTSPVFVRHFESYAADVMTRFAIAQDSLAVDIGSNDGTLLSFFKAGGCRVVGIDPAKDIAARATAAGIPTIADFFGPALAARIRAENGPARVITANNVFAHIDDLTAIVHGVRDLLADDGVFAFEVSYLVDVFEKTLFDTIYHEHLDYHSVLPLVSFFQRNGMQLIEAVRVDSHGGSLRAMVQKQGGPRPVGASVDQAIAVEKALGLDRAATFHAFAANIEERKRQLSQLLRRLKGEGKSIAAFGAPAKATTLMYHFDIGPDLIDFIVDDSPLKQGLFSPGMHIPVVSSSAITERRPDYLVILAWNFAQPIMQKHSSYLEAGGHFVVPLPTVEVY